MDNIRIKDLGLIINEDTLVISDLHIGFEEALSKQGVLVPRFHFKDLILHLESILKDLQLKTIIINGDLKHEFGKISEQEWRETLKVLDFLGKHCEEIILVQGNHDTIIGPIANKRKVKVVKEYRLDGILITHGDKIPKMLEPIIIIGHEHPAISLHKNGRTERYKCFLFGKYKKSKLIVLPSFSTLTEGSDVLKEKQLSPFLKDGVLDFEIFIIEDGEVFPFGRLKDLKKLS